MTPQEYKLFWILAGVGFLGCQIVVSVLTHFLIKWLES